MAILDMPVMTEQDRKDHIEQITGGLKCRCPGYQVMDRLVFKTFEGIKYGYFACSEPNSTMETRYPIGYPTACRCGLGTKPNNVSARYHQDEEALWGYAECSELPPTNTTGIPKPGLVQQKQEAELWGRSSNWILPMAIMGGAATIFFLTVRGK